jgi:hypothetical protein
MTNSTPPVERAWVSKVSLLRVTGEAAQRIGHGDRRDAVGLKAFDDAVAAVAGRSGSVGAAAAEGADDLREGHPAGGDHRYGHHEQGNPVGTEPQPLR